MKKDEILRALSNFIKPSEASMLYELIARLDERFLQGWYLQILALDYKSFGAMIKALKQVLANDAKRKAEVGRIKGYKGARLEEQDILEGYFYQQELNKLPYWFSSFGS